jgi:hypothetical protein
MSEKTPDKPDNIQLTPVGFSPPSQDALGTVGGKVPFREMQFPMALPVAIMLLSLIYSEVRDISGMNRRMAEMDRQNAPAVEKLERIPKQSEFIDSLRQNLVKLAPTDPAAAALLKQYFPSPPKDESQTAPAK